MWDRFIWFRLRLSFVSSPDHVVVPSPSGLRERHSCDTHRFLRVRSTLVVPQGLNQWLGGQEKGGEICTEYPLRGLRLGLWVGAKAHLGVDWRR